MSRIGKKPVSIPAGVTIDVTGGVVMAKGPKGELTQSFDTRHVKVEVSDGAARVDRLNDSAQARAMHGLYRALIANMVTGVTDGYRRELEINGVGYTAKAEGKKLTLQIGFCHPVVFEAADGIAFETPSATRIVVSGIDKQRVGQLAAEIRRVRPPEPYKGKGIKYRDEVIRRKAGKTVAAK